MSTPVDTKGTIFNVLRAVDETEPKLVLNEIIDDVEHSNSNKIFIDFSLHDNQVIVGFEKKACIDDMNSMLKWNTLKDKQDVSMSTCGVGIKYFMYYFRGEIHIISKTDNQDNYLEAFLNSKKIYDELQKNNDEVSNNKFLEILSRCTSYPKEIDYSDIRSKQKIYFDNSKTDIPFKPELLFFIDKCFKNKMIENILKDGEEYISKIKKNLNSKYYLNIAHDNLELYLKFPNKDWELLKGYDTIGHDHRKFSLSVTICGIKSENKMDIIKCNNTYYQISKNGSSGGTIRKKYTGNTDIIEEFYGFNQYNIDISDEELKKNINGKTCEEYAGIYLKLGSYIINDLPIKTALVKRNFGGAKNYRALLTPKNENAKNKLNIKGLKGSFDLTQMEILHKTIQVLVSSIYKKYYDAFCKNPDVTPDIDDIFIVENSNKKKLSSRDTKDTSGHSYIIRLGETLWKHGITTGGKNDGIDRVKNYGDKNTYDKIKFDYPNENIYDIQDIDCVFLTLKKCKNIKGLESDVLDYINTNSKYRTYNSKIKTGQISEFFSCDEADIKYLIDFIKIQKNCEGCENCESDDNK